MRSKRRREAKSAEIVRVVRILVFMGSPVAKLLLSIMIDVISTLVVFMQRSSGNCQEKSVVVGCRKNLEIYEAR